MNPRALGAFALALGLTGAAHGVPTVFDDDLPRGSAAFDAALRAGGVEVSTQMLRFLADGGTRFEFADFTIEATDGTRRFVEDDYADLRAAGVTGAMSGWAIGISPNAPAAGSGLSFTFREPVNAFGIEVGDWATCCYASALYIAFDGGATRLVARATSANDNPGWIDYRQFTNFVGAVDTSGAFTKVTFYGDGIGEYMVAGGTIRYSALPVQQAVDLPFVPTAVPEPVHWQLALAGLAALALFARRRARG